MKKEEIIHQCDFCGHKYTKEFDKCYDKYEDKVESVMCGCKAVEVIYKLEEEIKILKKKLRNSK